MYIKEYDITYLVEYGILKDFFLITKWASV